MLVPLSWLRDFTPVDLPVDEVAATLSDLGLAVESIRPVGEGLDGVVVARVLAIHAIEGADRIRRVEVDTGGPEPVQVVCGAWNFQAGDLVPLATVGSVLPGGFEIGRRKMKGIESQGMLCAPDELALPGDHDGILVLPGDLETGRPFADAMGIEPDVVLELEVNPNRPDCSSIAGVARDLAARLRLPFRIPEPQVDTGGDPSPAAATVEVLDAERCGRFVARVLRGVQLRPSPAWLARRLTLAGMRPINNVVDASNYVMLELGQPNHPYDLGRLPGRGLRVRTAAEAETIVTLDDVERRLSADDLLICDAEDAPVGIAGVMGGAAAEIADDTAEVLLEAAWFHPMSVAWTSKRLGLRTEASARFERGVDHEGIDRAVDRFCELLGAEGAAVAAPGSVDVRGRVPERPPVRLRTARVNAVLGTDLADSDIRGYLQPLGFTATPAGDGEHEVTIPTWRPDSAIEIDVVEEVARLHGYARIGRTVPPSAHVGRLTDRQVDRRRVRQILAGAGASEAWTGTFLAPDDLARCGLDHADAVPVANPLVAEQSRLRTSLLPGLVGAVAYNASHRNTGVHLFEVGHVFSRAPDRDALPVERERLAVALAGADAAEAVGVWRVLLEGLGVAGGSVDNRPVPGLHPSRSAVLQLAGEEVGWLGEVAPGVLAAHEIDERVAWLELDLDALLAAPRRSSQYRPVSRFPSSDIDLAFEVDESVPAGDVHATLQEAGGDLVVDLRLFDVYRGAPVAEGRRSLAWSVRMQAADRTLTDEEIAAVRRHMIEAVESTHPAALRG